MVGNPVVLKEQSRELYPIDGFQNLTSEQDNAGSSVLKITGDPLVLLEWQFGLVDACTLIYTNQGMILGITI